MNMKFGFLMKGERLISSYISGLDIRTFFAV